MAPWRLMKNVVGIERMGPYASRISSFAIASVNLTPSWFANLRTFCGPPSSTDMPITVSPCFS